jgi:hypothetical protein
MIVAYWVPVAGVAGLVVGFFIGWMLGTTWKIDLLSSGEALDGNLLDEIETARQAGFRDGFSRGYLAGETDAKLVLEKEKAKLVIPDIEAIKRNEYQRGHVAGELSSVGRMSDAYRHGIESVAKPMLDQLESPEKIRDFAYKQLARFNCTLTEFRYVSTAGKTTRPLPMRPTAKDPLGEKQWAKDNYRG